MPDKQYGTVITAQGAAIIANCIISGTKLMVAEAAAGDGGGAYYVPTTDQTALKNEKWRGEIASAELNPTVPNMIDVKIVIPDDVSGFVVRELALYTDNGTMLAVCNVPDTEKVATTGGVSGKLTALMHIVVADASVVEFTLVPALDTVTAEEVDAAIGQHNSSSTAHTDIRDLLEQKIDRVSPVSSGNIPQLTTEGALIDSGIPARLPTPGEINAVPTTRTINGKALSTDVSLNAGDVGAVPTTRTVNGKALSTDVSLNASDVEAVPTTRTVNGKALSSDIMLAAADVGAVPTSRTINDKPLSNSISLDAADVGAVPEGRTVNGQALTENITLGAADVDAVPTSRTINGKTLSSDIILAAADVSAVPTTRTINGEALSSDIVLAAADVGAVPTERKINGHALSSNITLDASDVDAVPTDRAINNKALSADITLTAQDVGAVPTTRTVNGKALSSNITLDADDVDAVPINYNVISGHLTRFGSLGTLVDSNISADKVQELLSPSPWIYPTIQHATDPGPGFQVRYTKTGNIVSLAGSFETWDAGEAIFTLPEGYRPLGVWTFPGFDNSKNPDTVQQISINGDNGSLSVQSGGDSSTGYLYFSTSFAVRGGGIIDEP